MDIGTCMAIKSRQIPELSSQFYSRVDYCNSPLYVCMPTKFNITYTNFDNWYSCLSIDSVLP